MKASEGVDWRLLEIGFHGIRQLRRVPCSQQLKSGCDTALHHGNHAAAMMRDDDQLRPAVKEAGKDESGHRDVERRFMCHSVRKSLLSALYGSYVQDGKIDPNATLGELGINDNEPSLTDS